MVKALNDIILNFSWQAQGSLIELPLFTAPSIGHISSTLLIREHHWMILIWPIPMFDFSLTNFALGHLKSCSEQKIRNHSTSRPLQSCLSCKLCLKFKIFLSRLSNEVYTQTNSYKIETNYYQHSKVL